MGDITFHLYEMNNVEIIMLDSNSDPNDNNDGNEDDDNDIMDFDIIVNPRVRNNPLSSTLSCGSFDSCHTWTSRGGLQISTDSLVGTGTDYAVLLLANTTNTKANTI